MFLAQQEAEVNNSEPSSLISVILPPETEPLPNITSEVSIINHHMISIVFFVFYWLLKIPTYNEFQYEIRPATLSPQRVPSSQISIPSPQPLLSIASPHPIPSTQQINSSPVCGLIIVCAGVVIGYASNVIGMLHCYLLFNL